MSDKKATNAYVFLNTKVGKEKSVLNEILKLPQTLEGKVTIGQWDVVMKVEVDKYEDLRPLVTNKIRALDDVIETWTMIVVD